MPCFNYFYGHMTDSVSESVMVILIPVSTLFELGNKVVVIYE